MSMGAEKPIYLPLGNYFNELGSCTCCLSTTDTLSTPSKMEQPLLECQDLLIPDRSMGAFVG